MAEFHEGICGSHIGGRALSLKAVRAGYYWSTMREDCTRYAQRCKQSQQHANWHKAPLEELRSIYSPWSFHTWGNWHSRAIPSSCSTDEVPRSCHWVLPKVDRGWASGANHSPQGPTLCVEEYSMPLWSSDNGTQFARQQLGKLCTELGIK